jgi:hypothetical protein
MCDAAAPAPAGACPAEPPPADVQAEAALLARCFHSAVVVLDREPGETEPLARFFAEAAAAATACGSPGLPGLALFRAAADGGTLLFSDGREVLAEHGPESRDLFEDGREEVSRTWRFHTADGSASAETTLTLTFGGSPD